MEYNSRYEELFSTDELKAKAFDKIAQCYYNLNFGSTSKGDIDVLMFHLYLERVLSVSKNDMNLYSDYTLSKQLGITQTRISALKEKKELKYPRKNSETSWKETLRRVCGNAILDGDKIKINLRDKYLFYEVKNFIEERGGLAETTLTRNVLAISLSDFIKLTDLLMTESEREEFYKALKKSSRDNKNHLEEFNKENLITLVKKKGTKTIIDVIYESIKVIAPGCIGTGIGIIKDAIENIKTN